MYINEYVKLNFRKLNQWDYLEDEETESTIDSSIEEVFVGNGYIKKYLMKNSLCVPVTANGDIDV